MSAEKDSTQIYNEVTSAIDALPDGHGSFDIADAILTTATGFSPDQLNQQSPDGLKLSERTEAHPDDIFNDPRLQSMPLGLRRIVAHTLTDYDPLRGELDRTKVKELIGHYTALEVAAKPKECDDVYWAVRPHVTSDLYMQLLLRDATTKGLNISSNLDAKKSFADSLISAENLISDTEHRPIAADEAFLNSRSVTAVNVQASDKKGGATVLTPMVSGYERLLGYVRRGTKIETAIRLNMEKAHSILDLRAIISSYSEKGIQLSTIDANNLRQAMDSKVDPAVRRSALKSLPGGFDPSSIAGIRASIEAAALPNRSKVEISPGDALIVTDRKTRYKKPDGEIVDSPDTGTTQFEEVSVVRATVDLDATNAAIQYARSFCQSLSLPEGDPTSSLSRAARLSRLDEESGRYDYRKFLERVASAESYLATVKDCFEEQGITLPSDRDSSAFAMIDAAVATAKEFQEDRKSTIERDASGFVTESPFVKDLKLILDLPRVFPDRIRNRDTQRLVYLEEVANSTQSADTSGYSDVLNEAYTESLRAILIEDSGEVHRSLVDRLAMQLQSVLESHYAIQDGLLSQEDRMGGSAIVITEGTPPETDENDLWQPTVYDLNSATELAETRFKEIEELSPVEQISRLVRLEQQFASVLADNCPEGFRNLQTSLKQRIQNLFLVNPLVVSELGLSEMQSFADMSASDLARKNIQEASLSISRSIITSLMANKTLWLQVLGHWGDKGYNDVDFDFLDLDQVPAYIKQGLFSEVTPWELIKNNDSWVQYRHGLPQDLETKIEAIREERRRVPDVSPEDRFATLTDNNKSLLLGAIGQEGWNVPSARRFFGKHRELFDTSTDSLALATATLETLADIPSAMTGFSVDNQGQVDLLADTYRFKADFVLDAMRQIAGDEVSGATAERFISAVVALIEGNENAAGILGREVALLIRDFKGESSHPLSQFKERLRLMPWDSEALNYKSAANFVPWLDIASPVN